MKSQVKVKPGAAPSLKSFSTISTETFAEASEVNIESSYVPTIPPKEFNDDRSAFRDDHS